LLSFRIAFRQPGPVRWNKGGKYSGRGEDVIMERERYRMNVSTQIARNLTAMLCAVLILPGHAGLWAMQEKPGSTSASPASPASPDEKLSKDQLDSLVAPVALYPDPLLGQTLVACTYPLEIVQLHQWLEKNKGLKDKALADAVKQQNWDPSIQAMAPFPDLAKHLAENIRWADDLGNAFLAQQSEVMEAVQRMRAKAVEKGALKSSEQQKVETKVIENKTVVVVEPAQKEVVYVPSYDPVAVWGSPYYPYPAMAYPYYPAGGMLLGFGVGVAMGAAWGGGWGWNTGWGNNNININRNNNFVNHYNNQRVNGGSRYGGAGNNWQHNPQHRGGAPYGNRATANRYNGAARGDTMGQRQTAARQNQRQPGASQFSGGSSTFGGANGQALNRGSTGTGGDRIGNRQVSNGSMGSKSSSAFSGGSSRSAAQASSSRGASSMGSRGGGGRGGGRRR
jgi:hypothetical protein